VVQFLAFECSIQIVPGSISTAVTNIKVQNCPYNANQSLKDGRTNPETSYVSNTPQTMDSVQSDIRVCIYTHSTTCNTQA